MTIPEAEYEAMTWEVRHTKTAVCKEYADLRDRFLEFEKETFEPPLSFDKVVRYIVLGYHKHSPLVKRRIEIGQRKEIALKEAGFEKEKVWSPEIRSVISNKNDVILKMIFQFLKFERQMRYSNLMMLYERYWSLSLSAVEFKTSVKDSKDTQDLLSLIEIEEDLVFAGDLDLGNHISAIQVVERRYIITPEQNAAMVKEKRKQKGAMDKDTLKDRQETLKMLRQED